MTAWIPESIQDRISSPPIPCPALDRILDQPDPEESPLKEMLESSDTIANRAIIHLQIDVFKRLNQFYAELIANIKRFIHNHPHIPLERIQREANEQLQRETQRIRRETAERIHAIRETQHTRDDGIHRNFKQEPPPHPTFSPPFQNPLHDPYQISISSDPKTGGMGWQI